MGNGGTTILGIILWAVVAALYGLSGLFVEPLGGPLGWPILLSVLALWVCPRLPTPFYLRIVILGMGLFTIWYSSGFIL